MSEPTCRGCLARGEHGLRMEERANRAEFLLTSARDLAEQRRVALVEAEKNLAALAGLNAALLRKVDELNRMQKGVGAKGPA